MSTQGNFGGRPQLIDMPRILEAALEMGVDNLTMHGVARKLGVSPPALYRYVSSREALLDACMDHFCSHIVMPDPELHWRPYLTAMGRAFRQALHDTPGASNYGFKIGPTTPAAFHIINSALGVLRRDGFGARDAFTAYSLVIDHAMTSVQKEERMAVLEAQNGPGGYRILQLKPEEISDLPHLAQALSEWLSLANPYDFDEGYNTQLECLIAGIEQQYDAGA